MDESAIFAAALEHTDPAQRRAFLEGACPGDPELQARISGLLWAHENPDEFLDSPAGGAPSGLGGDLLPATIESSLSRETIGSQTGPYKLLQQLGEGGMGVVYMAEQIEPVKRRVALKVIKPGMDSRQVIARFEAERQALALMDHPNIAKVLDASTTESGRPYFVMELVKGIPLTTYSDEQHLTPKERLKLFIPVCQAVQHAHQKGIIHRDLKPSNVLVALYDGEPVPKVIDFGVAKATSQQLTEKTMFTAVGQIVGTLEYMSPEQAQVNQLDVDTRSDIYSLGVLLYELLTGATPFDRQRLRSAAFDEMMRIIREEDPPRPSVRLSTIDTLASIASSRRTEPRKLRTLVRGELDWIVMKALEKDRARRYETANGFSADIQRYLNDEAVVACPPSAGYRFRKFARRNKALLATASMIALALMFGMVGTTWQAHRAKLAEIDADLGRDTAEQERRKAELLAEKEAAAREATRRLLYVSDMNVAAQEWTDGYVDRVVELLKRHQPQDGEEDLRGFEWYHLWNLCKRPLEAPTLQNTETIFSVSFSHDGKRLASGGKTLVTVWDIETKATTTFDSDATYVWSVSFSPDGERMASANYGKTLKMWNTETGLLERTFDLEGPVGCVTFSPLDGMIVACGDIGGKVTLWNVLTGEVVKELQHGKIDSKDPMSWDVMIWDIAFSRDGRFLASGSWDGTVRVWDVDSGEELCALPVNDPIKSLDFSPDGKTLAVRALRAVTLWDLAERKARLLTEDVGAEYLGAVAYSPDGKILVSDGQANTVKLWDVASGKELATMTGHSAEVSSVAFSPDGKILSSASMDGSVKLWDLAVADDRSILAGHSGIVHSVSVSPDGTLVASGGPDGVKIWEARTRSLRETIETDHGVLCVAHCRDGQWIAYGGQFGMVNLWNLLTRQERVLSGADDAIWTVKFSPDGQYLAAGGEDGTVRFWDLRTSDPKPVTLRKHAGPVRSLVFSPDGVLMASAGADLSIKLWDAASIEVVDELSSHTQEVRTLAISRDGKTLASGGAERKVNLWDLESRTVRASFTGAGSVFGLAFSPDGTTLASAGDRSVRLWNVETEEEQVRLRGHSNIWSLAFSPADGRTLVAGFADGTLKLWQAATTEEVRTATWWGSVTRDTNRE